jgi:hypothetical protein
MRIRILVILGQRGGFESSTPQPALPLRLVHHVEFAASAGILRLVLLCWYCAACKKTLFMISKLIKAQE